jgi:hypothetical protein
MPTSSLTRFSDGLLANINTSTLRRIALENKPRKTPRLLGRKNLGFYPKMMRTRTLLPFRRRSGERRREKKSGTNTYGKEIMMGRNGRATRKSSHGSAGRGRKGTRSNGMTWTLNFRRTRILGKNGSD